MKNFEKINEEKFKKHSLNFIEEKKETIIIKEKEKQQKNCLIFDFSKILIAKFEKKFFFYELSSKEIEIYKKICSKKNFSNANEWLKVIQKISHFSSEKVGESNLIISAFEAILKLNERMWYEEIIQLYLVKIIKKKNLIIIKYKF